MSNKTPPSKTPEASRPYRHRLGLYLMPPTGLELLGACFILLFWLPVFASDVSLIGICAIPAFLVARGLRVHLELYRHLLRERATQKGGVQWHVEINQVHCGTINDTELARIRLEVFGDTRIYLLQGLAWLIELAKMLAQFLLALPTALFWVVAAAIVLTPEAAVREFNALSRIGLEQVIALCPKAFISHFLPMLAATFVFTVCVRLALHSQGNPLWEFTDAVQKRLRQQIGLSSTGALVLYLDPAPEYPERRLVCNELAQLLAARARLLRVPPVAHAAQPQ